MPERSTSERLTVRKTYKLYIGGAFPRSESGRSYPVTDAKGRFLGKGERDQGHTAEPDISPVQHENELFSKEIGEFLDKARNEHRYDKLHVIAPPRFLGLLRKNISKETKKMVGEEIVRDISWQNKREIEEFVRMRKL